LLLPAGTALHHGGVMEDTAGSGPVSELLSRASTRQPVHPGDARGGSVFERVSIDGQGYFLKCLSRSRDWTMRVMGDRVHRPYLVWQAGMMDRVPACIDHTVVAMEVNGAGEASELLMLMRDVGQCLLPEGDAVVGTGVHGGFIEHMAQLAASFWGWVDADGLLTSMPERLRSFAPDTIAPELQSHDAPSALVAADAGWRQLPGRSPLLASAARMGHDAPGLLAGPLGETPVTFLHGDWKMGNLGTHPDGRTILLDWSFPGAGPACWELCWYLALNRARLPESKEAAIERYRQALEHAGITTAGWFEAQLDLCLVGVMACFAWEKALGEEDELRWWEARVGQAVRRQGLQAG
jgi:hypothetical protein